jgi:hypothetical protein
MYNNPATAPTRSAQKSTAPRHPTEPSLGDIHPYMRVMRTRDARSAATAGYASSGVASDESSNRLSATQVNNVLRVREED